MEIARKEAFVLVRLEHGEDIIESIKQTVKEERSTMVLVVGLGMISDFELGFFDRGNYLTQSYNDPHELLSLQGTIATEGEPRIHIHATVANKEHEEFGGHLMRGRDRMNIEIRLLSLYRLISGRI